MYLEYWGFKEYPFENVPDPRFFYVSRSHEEALSRLLYAIRMRKGAALLSGEIGCGKTTLTKVCFQYLAPEEYDIGVMVHPKLEGVEFLQEILYQFGVDNGSDTKVKCLHSLHEKMLKNLRARKETLLMIDEAHLLTPAALEEIRLLLNFQLNDRLLITIILLGQPELIEKVKELQQLEQRIPIKYQLTPFDQTESIQYILFRQKRAGKEDSAFTEEAMQRIHDYTEGVPRKINNLSDLSLLIGFCESKKEIKPEIIEKIINDGTLL